MEQFCANIICCVVGMKEIAILLDAAHGASANPKMLWLNGNKIKESDFNKMLLNRILILLKSEHINVSVINDGVIDVDITNRILKTNSIIDRYSDKQFIFICLHGKIFETFTWGCVSKGDQISGQVADIYCGFAEDVLGLPIKRISIDDVNSVQKYGIIKDVNCPAILTENKVNRTLKDLYTEEDIEKLVNLHVNAIKAISKYIQL